ncbi:MAG: hypothetical protein JHC93_07475, partial [Parachlamydiales bacterium]|nr:hypothetical protein [Parachlamydiales bacterium]
MSTSGIPSNASNPTPIKPSIIPPKPVPPPIPGNKPNDEDYGAPHPHPNPVISPKPINSSDNDSNDSGSEIGSFDSVSKTSSTDSRSETSSILSDDEIQDKPSPVNTSVDAKKSIIRLGSKKFLVGLRKNGRLHKLEEKHLNSINEILKSQSVNVDDLSKVNIKINLIANELDSIVITGYSGQELVSRIFKSPSSTFYATDSREIENNYSNTNVEELYKFAKDFREDVDTPPPVSRFERSEVNQFVPPAVSQAAISYSKAIKKSVKDPDSGARKKLINLCNLLKADHPLKTFNERIQELSQNIDQVVSGKFSFLGFSFDFKKYYPKAIDESKKLQIIFNSELLQFLEKYEQGKLITENDMMLIFVLGQKLDIFKEDSLNGEFSDIIKALNNNFHTYFSSKLLDSDINKINDTSSDVFDILKDFDPSYKNSETTSVVVGKLDISDEGTLLHHFINHKTAQLTSFTTSGLTAELNNNNNKYSEPPATYIFQNESWWCQKDEKTFFVNDHEVNEALKSALKNGGILNYTNTNFSLRSNQIDRSHAVTNLEFNNHVSTDMLCDYLHKKTANSDGKFELCLDDTSGVRKPIIVSQTINKFDFSKKAEEFKKSDAQYLIIPIQIDIQHNPSHLVTYIYDKSAQTLTFFDSLQDGSDNTDLDTIYTKVRDNLRKEFAPNYIDFFSKESKLFAPQVFNNDSDCVLYSLQFVNQFIDDQIAYTNHAKHVSQISVNAKSPPTPLSALNQTRYKLYSAKPNPKDENSFFNINRRSLLSDLKKQYNTSSPHFGFDKIKYVEDTTPVVSDKPFEVLVERSEKVKKVSEEPLRNLRFEATKTSAKKPAEEIERPSTDTGVPILENKKVKVRVSAPLIEKTQSTSQDLETMAFELEEATSENSSSSSLTSSDEEQPLLKRGSSKNSTQSDLSSSSNSSIKSDIRDLTDVSGVSDSKKSEFLENFTETYYPPSPTIAQRVTNIFRRGSNKTKPTIFETLPTLVNSPKIQTNIPKKPVNDSTQTSLTPIASPEASRIFKTISGSNNEHSDIQPLQIIDYKSELSKTDDDKDYEIYLNNFAKTNPSSKFKIFDNSNTNLSSLDYNTLTKFLDPSIINHVGIVIFRDSIIVIIKEDNKLKNYLLAPEKLVYYKNLATKKIISSVYDISKNLNIDISKYLTSEITINFRYEFLNVIHN